MTVATDDFLRRIRALVTALGLLQRSLPDSVGYAEFRRKLEKCVRLVLNNTDELLREVLKADGADHAAVVALPQPEVLRHAQEHGLLNAEEAGRWLGYFDRMLPGAGVAYTEETLVQLRAFVVDARSLEATLRAT